MGSIVPIPPVPHPFDPLSPDEIAAAVATVKKQYDNCSFNVVSLHEPRKADMLKWLDDQANEALRPARVADIVVIVKGGKVYDCHVDLSKGPTITKWEHMEGVQPIVSQNSFVASIMSQAVYA
jgi:primary-amine oxidase